MLSDALFRLVNVAGGLALDDDLWRRQVLGPNPASARRSTRARIAVAAGAWCEEASAPVRERLAGRTSLTTCN